MNKIIKEVQKIGDIKKMLEPLNMVAYDCEVVSVSKNAVNIVGRIRESLVSKTNNAFVGGLQAQYENDEISSYDSDACWNCYRENEGRFCTQCNWLKCVAVILEEHFSKICPEYEFRMGMDLEHDENVWFEFYRKER